MQSKKWTKIGFILVLAFTLLLSACSSDKKNNEGGENKKGPASGEDASGVNLTGLPIVSDQVTLKFMTTKAAQQKKPHEEMKVVKDFETETNVHIEWDAAVEGYAEKKNLMFAGGELPDVFFGAESLTDDDLMKYGPQGMLIALEDLIPKFAPHIHEILEANPEIKKMITAPDGHIYSIPQIQEGPEQALGEVMFINKAWLDKLGLPVPATTEEFEQTLKAFKEKDPNGNNKADEIPLSFLYGNTLNGISSFHGAFGLLDTPAHISVKDDKVVFNPAQTEYKEATAYLGKLFTQGLIDKEVFTHDRNVYFAKGKNEGVALYGVFSGFRAVNVVGAEHMAQYVPLPPLKGTGGSQLWNEYNPHYFTRAGFAITSENRHPEVSLRWVDELYKEKNALQWAYGPIGTTLKENPDGGYSFLPTPEGMNFDEFRHSEAPGNTTATAILMDTADKLESNEAKLERMEYLKVYEPFMENTTYPNILFSAEDTERMAILKADIMSYVLQMQPNWIMNGTVDKEWDGFIKKLDDMGLKEMLDILQSNYERYQSLK
ncbi:extracellular solute-binding protein [Paenibacillus alkaliterrae]|uniref:extracellular solute-binding protein n=1 Tax=Paenibacillus alkaliterrae TaxID=320909 RepID=UPI001F1E3B0E|nr:extracellular solute-binding protein [Paenibacillus alkaliterrae]MCF2941076.1 extracellular solute-binding protein [Paenibacillus alkaliterrae]